MNTFQKLTFGFLLVAGLMFTACEDDPVVDTDPTLTLISGSEFEEANLNRGDTIALTIRAMAGTEDLSSLVFFEDGTRLEGWQNRLRIEDQDPPSNALALQGDQTSGFTWDVTILADSTAGEHELIIELTDAGNNTAVIPISYTTVTIDTLNGVLFNQAGPADRGGLDLDLGISTGTVDPSDTIAEIRDLGIDLGEPEPENWIQKIAPYDDAILVSLDSEFDFSSVVTDDDIIAAYTSGAEIQESNVVEVGDAFAVRDGARYYVFIVTEVNIDPDGNDDNYVLNIKKTL